MGKLLICYKNIKVSIINMIVLKKVNVMNIIKMKVVFVKINFIFVLCDVGWMYFCLFFDKILLIF